MEKLLQIKILDFSLVHVFMVNLLLIFRKMETETYLWPYQTSMVEIFYKNS